jgi:hypothetical protein
MHAGFRRLLHVALAVLAAACASEGDGWVPPLDSGVDTAADTAGDTTSADSAHDPGLDTGLVDTAADPGTDPDASEDPGDPILVPLCLERCITSHDCGSSTTPAYSSDNYACVDGFCVYTGCLSDAECVAGFGAGWGCQLSAAIPVCLATCSSVSDCGSSTTPAYSSDNYACTDGLCVYTGCHTTAECVDTTGAGYGCYTGYDPHLCMEVCSTTADCGTPSSPAYGSDNYRCTDGFCIYSKCLSHAECVDSFGSEYGCRGL